MRVGIGEAINQPAGFPEVWLDLFGALPPVIIFNSTSSLFAFSLTTDFNLGLVSPGLPPGARVVLQAFAMDASAANGIFAATDAMELRGN